MSDDIYDIFDPIIIYEHCKNGIDKFRPGCDFIIWDSKSYKLTATTFSREAPILAFESTSDKKALGVILRPSLIKYGDYLFSSIKEALGDDITVTLVTCNHFNYEEGSIPSIIEEFALIYGMNCLISEDSDSEKNPECYHREESGNHIVAMW